MDITSAALATIISALTSALVAVVIARLNSDRDRKKDLESRLEGILKIAVQYPYLESRDFANAWVSEFDSSDEKRSRYEIYCILVFNYLASLADFHKFNPKDIEGVLGVKEWVRLHARYWMDPPDAYENIDGYDKRFVDLINGYLKG